MGMDGAGSTEQTAPCSVLPAVMRPEGLEPPRVAPPAPKAGASANSATVASFCEMYLSRVLLSSLSNFWSLSMVRTRSSIVLAVALCAAVFTRPAAGQASQDKDKICSQVQNRTLAVGTWATYTWTGGSTNGSTMQMVISSPGMNMAADLARQCQAMEVVGWELVTVPGGEFRALHMRNAGSQTVSEVWLQPAVPAIGVRSPLRFQHRAGRALQEHFLVGGCRLCHRRVAAVDHPRALSRAPRCSRTQARAWSHRARDRVDTRARADPRLHRRSHNARNFRDGGARPRRRAAGRGHRSPVVVGIPVPDVEHQRVQ